VKKAQQEAADTVGMSGLKKLMGNSNSSVKTLFLAYPAG
jgi:hypothetical protein